MKTLVIAILVIAVGAGVYWYLANSGHSAQVQQVQDQASKTAAQVKQTVQDKFKDFSLSGPEIKQELERTGKVVRKKAQEVGVAIADATADARTTAAIKARLVKDSNRSALKISVNTTEGVVTLSGSVASPEVIREAMQVALDTEGVREVISTLQVKSAK
jgi:hyperosmotically inducible periplasmic protein